MPSSGESSGQAWLDSAHEAYRTGRIDQAIRAYRAALAAGADAVTVHNDLGVALGGTARTQAAIVHYRRALEIDPDSAESWSNLASLLFHQGRVEEAAAAARRAAELAPDDRDIAMATGVTLRRARAAAEALGYFDRLREREPGNPAVAFERAVTLLTLGRFREGFADYEARFDSGRASRREMDRPEWRGEPLGDRNILILAEQGHGDMIQFARLIPRVRAMTRGTVQVECLPNLARLFQKMAPEIRAFPANEQPAPYDLTVPLMSLPLVLGLEEGDLANQAGYLRAPASGRWQGLVAEDNKLKVGLTWAGNDIRIERSCPFPEFLGIAEVPGVAFYSLQRGAARADITAYGAADLVHDLGTRLGDFADDAEVIEELDLVVTIDTAMCHLAAALGKPTWTLLPFAADWRFGETDERCLWYPTMRLFRQQRPRDWRPVIHAVRQALGVLVRERETAS